MATTDARAGFRLPWSSDRSSTDESDQLETAEATAEPTTEPAERVASDGWPNADAKAPDVAEPTEAIADEDGQPYVAENETMPDTAAATRTPSGRKPSKFLADLTKAMQTAAEEARGIALSQLQAEAKSHVEQIHARSSTEAANLRRQADDDVAAVREWSKAEIARIREDTEAKISERKGQLESQIENHAAVIEREIEAVQSTVAGFEADMATFFERLLAEEDPTQFATMAERLPEPPTFSSILVAHDPEPSGLIAFLRAMAGGGATAPTPYTVGWYLTPELWLVLAAAAVGSTPWVPLAARGLESRPRSVPPLALSIVNTAALAALLVASLTHVAARTYNPFIYFRF